MESPGLVCLPLTGSAREIDRHCSIFTNLQGRRTDINFPATRRAEKLFSLVERDAQNAIWSMGKAALLAVIFRFTERTKAPARSEA